MNWRGLLDKSIARPLKLLTRQGYLGEEEGVSYLADVDADNPLAWLQAASCTYRIARVPRPRLHLTRFHGVLAPNAGLRGAIVPRPVHKPGERAEQSADAYELGAVGQARVRR